MRIFPVVFAFERDLDLVLAQRQLMRRLPVAMEEHTLVVDPAFAPPGAYRDILVSSGIRMVRRPRYYFPWGSWDHCLSKLGGYVNVLKALEPSDEDYILDMDSDSFLLDGQMLRFLGQAEFVGIRFENRFTWVDRFQKFWSHVFGSFMALRASALRRAVSLPACDRSWARTFFRKNPFYEMVNEQFVSLLMEMVGASGLFPENAGLFCEGPEAEHALLEGGKGFSIVHLYGQWKMFAGRPIEDKYCIPRVMRELGLI